MSRQCDIIVYDALNSAVYRKGSRVMILPSDNVAAVIEVKSRLNKRQLEDAAEKIASVKRLKRAGPPRNPQAAYGVAMTRPLGIVFAYESETKPDTLAENLAAINAIRPARELIDLVVILDVAVIGFFFQQCFATDLAWYGGATADDFMIPPYYVHLGVERLGELALNRLFLNLTLHLAVYREQPFVSQEALIGQRETKVLPIRAYQYNLSRELAEVDVYHRQGSLAGPTLRFNLFQRSDDAFVGQVGWLPWQDGGVITYSGLAPPGDILRPFARVLGDHGTMIPNADGAIVLSPVVSVTAEEFEKLARQIDGGVVALRDDEPGGAFHPSLLPRPPA